MIDQRALACYCSACGNYDLASEQLEAEGLITHSPKGYPMQSAWLAIQHRSADLIRQFSAEFGLSPSARTRITVQVPIRDELDEFLERSPMRT